MKIFHRTSGDLVGTRKLTPSVALHMQNFRIFEAFGELKIGKEILREDVPSEVLNWPNLKKKQMISKN